MLHPLRWNHCRSCTPSQSCSGSQHHSGPLYCHSFRWMSSRFQRQTRCMSFRLNRICHQSRLCPIRRCKCRNRSGTRHHSDLLCFRTNHRLSSSCRRCLPCTSCCRSRARSFRLPWCCWQCRCRRETGSPFRSGRSSRRTVRPKSSKHQRLSLCSCTGSCHRSSHLGRVYRSTGERCSYRSLVGYRDVC